ncbi:MAG: YggS family pyridoxal phosphate-dependent enzyme [Flavobacteriaceae bacterium]|nr:YggS family pyridoxal phosphate-dependent enzyme [Flavobacteriaceae bacterium]MDG2503627.1 YggS family pyridoxal phosphate-dependent enzyme [Flavobacteriaceae bacterium]
MKIAKNIIELKNSLSETVTLIAVSKTKPQSDLIEAYKAGQRDFGENKIQEMLEKWEHLPKDIHWHMIGHVQTNKVKYMAPFVHLIHAVDSLKLLKEIQKQALKNNRTIGCLIQIRIAQEETKFGLPAEELSSLVEAAKQFPNVAIKGLMGMASFTPNQEQVRQEFKKLAEIFSAFKLVKPENNILSMGMSGDYQMAIEEGSTMIRVGSKIFGERN